MQNIGWVSQTRMRPKYVFFEIFEPKMQKLGFGDKRAAEEPPNLSLSVRPNLGVETETGDIKRRVSSSLSSGREPRSVTAAAVDFGGVVGLRRRQHSVADRGRRVGLARGRERRPGRGHGQGEEHGRARTLVRKEEQWIDRPLPD